MNSWDPNAPRSPQPPAPLWTLRRLTAVDDELFQPVGRPQARVLGAIGRLHSLAFAMGALLLAAAVYLLMQAEGAVLLGISVETLTFISAGAAMGVVLLAAWGVRARPLEGVDDVAQVLGARVAVIERGTESDVR